MSSNDQAGLQSMAAVISTLHERGALSRQDLQPAADSQSSTHDTTSVKQEQPSNQASKQAVVLSLLSQLKDAIGLDEDSHERAVSMALGWNDPSKPQPSRSMQQPLNQSTHWPSTSSINSMLGTPRSVSSGSELPLSELTEAQAEAHQPSDRSVDQDFDEDATDDDQPLIDASVRQSSAQTAGKAARGHRSSSRSKAKNGKGLTTKKGQSQFGATGSTYMNIATFLSYFRASRSLSEAVKRIIADFPSYREVSIYARARRLKCRFDVKGRFYQSNGKDDGQNDGPFDGRRSQRARGSGQRSRSTKRSKRDQSSTEESSTSASDMDCESEFGDEANTQQGAVDHSMKQSQQSDSETSESGASDSDTESDTSEPERQLDSVSTEHLDLLAEASRLWALAPPVVVTHAPAPIHQLVSQPQHAHQSQGQQIHSFMPQMLPAIRPMPIKKEPSALSAEELAERALTEATKQTASRLLSNKHHRAHSMSTTMTSNASMAQFCASHQQVKGQGANHQQQPVHAVPPTVLIPSISAPAPFAAHPGMQQMQFHPDANKLVAGNHNFQAVHAFHN